MSILTVRVDLILKSGMSVRFYCSGITATRRQDNSLSAIEITKPVGWPLYIRLDDVSAVVTRRMPFWCAWGRR
ncbi:hypothetical protein ASG17_07770 [Brevundimonas sp. Leaf363]|uniref:hypothetical protein n=1 Tax=Brevundimonas sp. Leaf363 TaxID=1736353 RepID=UPI0006F382F1|nr:hypothetical protein [Brevundimonas sp. Leaf363]KQS55940.1 hypothetical protein ASG17_07770 [Brevundimonas sp. Leaf363]